MGISEVPEEEEISITYQKNKRAKTTELSDLPKTDSEITKEEDGSTPPGLPHRLSTSLNQPVEFEPVSHCCFERMSGKGANAGNKNTELSDLPKTDSEITKDEDGSTSPGLPHKVTSLDQPVKFEPVSPCCFERMCVNGAIAGDKISMEAVDSTLLEEAVDCCLGFEKSTLNGVEEVQIDTSNGNINKNCCDVDMLTVSPLEENGGVFPRVACGDGLNQDPPLPLENHQSAPVANDASTINENSCDALAIKLLEENVRVHNVESAKENIDEFPRASSGDALHLDHDERSVASNDDCSLTQSGVLNGLSSEVVNESVNMAVDKAFAGYTGKKLLVLDVNGLLVDISSYVPYDYDPDEIILRKAVFKRPYCDDFLKFCLERFNVGVWSSKTKRNMEPILDFLLGKDKSNLLFCWDQSHCTYTGYNTVEKRHKPLLLKKLKKLWDKCEPDLPWERGIYNESNTLLLDDSPYKALCNPRYTAIFPYTYRFRDLKDNSLGPEGDLCVYLKGLAIADNVQEYVKQNPFGQRPITERNLSWGFYLKVIEASSSPLHQTANDSKTQREQV